MLDDRTSAHIKREMQQIEKLLTEFHELIEKSRTSEPILVEYTALGAVLQSFYNGVENIFQTIAKRIDEETSVGESWHKDLLLQMGREHDNRTPVISQATIEKLLPYLGFRHIARHSYTFFLEWDKMQQLVWELSDVWGAVNAEIEAFVENV